MNSILFLFMSTPKKQEVPEEHENFIVKFIMMLLSPGGENYSKVLICSELGVSDSAEHDARYGMDIYYCEPLLPLL